METFAKLVSFSTDVSYIHTQSVVKNLNRVDTCRNTANDSMGIYFVYFNNSYSNCVIQSTNSYINR